MKDKLDTDRPLYKCLMKLTTRSSFSHSHCFVLSGSELRRKLQASPSIFQDTSRLSAVPGRAQQYSVQFYNLASIAARHCVLLIMYFASREELINQNCNWTNETSYLNLPVLTSRNDDQHHPRSMCQHGRGHHRRGRS